MTFKDAFAEWGNDDCLPACYLHIAYSVALSEGPRLLSDVR